VTPTVLLDGKFFMMLVTIDVTIFDLSAYYNAKMDSLEFLEMGNVPIYHWSANDHEISDTCRVSCPPYFRKYCQKSIVPARKKAMIPSFH